MKTKTETLLIAAIMGLAALANAGAQDNPILEGQPGEVPGAVKLRITNPEGGQLIDGYDVLIQGPFTVLYRIYGTATGCNFGVIEPGERKKLVVGVDNPSPCDAKIPPGWTLACGVQHQFTVFPFDDQTNLSNSVFITLPCE